MYQSAAFYTYYDKSKTGVANLLQENIQTNMINLKHLLEKHIKENNINNIIANLDNFVASNEIIQDVHLLNSQRKLIYSSHRDNYLNNHDADCIHISQTMDSNIFQEKCYYFTIKLYRELDPHYYYAYIYTNQSYIDSLLKNQTQSYITLYIFLTLIFLLLLWFSLHKFIIAPLQELKHYANHSEFLPKKFFVQEFESLRCSLSSTFKRMKQEQQKLYNLSTRDPLSGLYNRLSLIEKIDWLIAQSKRTDEGFSLVFLDLDNFKNINDSYGHEFGDVVLKKIANVIGSSLRETDIISRFGGDEFVVLLPNITQMEQIENVLTKLQQKLIKPIEYQHVTYNTTSSMGVVIYPKDGNDSGTLLKNADIAMYNSKNLGKNNFSFFTSELNQELKKRLHTKAMIETALKNASFELFYQPQVDVSTGNIVACEALLRMIDPLEGIIPPDKFIPIAEQNNLIVPIGKWVIKEVVSQIKRWENTPFSELQVSLNISAIELNHKEFLETVEALTQTVDRSKICIELTESVLISRFDVNIKKIQRLKELGFSLSLDDFGTGYSSLSYLKNIPFDELKIDKSFIDDILDDPKDRMFIEVIIDIAKTMNLQVLAEGVEDHEQLKILSDLQCDVYQGYFCSKPLKSEEFEQLFRLNKSYN